MSRFAFRPATGLPDIDAPRFTTALRMVVGTAPGRRRRERLS